MIRMSTSLVESMLEQVGSCYNLFCCFRNYCSFFLRLYTSVPARHRVDELQTFEFLSAPEVLYVGDECAVLVVGHGHLYSVLVLALFSIGSCLRY